MAKNLLIRKLKTGFKATRIAIVFSCIASLYSAQSVVSFTAPQGNGFNLNFLTPNTTVNSAFMRGYFFIHQQELAPNANVSITSFSIPIVNNTNTVATVGNFTLYMENSPFIFLNAPWGFSGMIQNMTTVYAGTLLIPAGSNTCMTVNLQTPFLYTGKGMNIAYDWENPGPYNTTALDAECSSQFAGLTAGSSQYFTLWGSSPSAAPPTLGNYFYARPAFRFGGLKQYSNDLYIVDGGIPGQILSSGNSENAVIYVGNSGTTTAQNVTVALLSSGINNYTATQVIPQILPATTQSITLNNFSPSISGLTTVTATILNPDQDISNNSAMFSQSVTCNEICPGFCGTQFNNVFAGTGAPGIYAYPFSVPVTRTLTAVKIRASVYLGPNISSLPISGVLTDAAGNIIAQTASITVTTGALASFSFQPAVVLTPNTDYYYGIQVTDNGVYPLSAALTPTQTGIRAVGIPLGGGTPFPLMDDLGTPPGMFAVFNYSAPAISAGASKYTCSGSSATLTASGASTYTWSTNANTNSIVVSPLVTTNYTVRTSNSQCNAYSTVSVIVSPIPSPTITGSPTLCLGASKTYTATGAWSYTWASGTNATQDYISFQQVGVNTITLTAANIPCPPVTASFQVNVKALPAINLLSPLPALCNTSVGGTTVQLNGQPIGGVYSGSMVSPTGVVTPSLNGNLTAFYSYTNTLSTCSATTSIQLMISECNSLTELTAEGGFKIYPNPVKDGRIWFDAEDVSYYRITDLNGRVVQHGQIERTGVDVSFLPAGVYIIFAGSNPHSGHYTRLLVD